MDRIKLTREEAVRRWQASLATKRKLVNDLEDMLHKSFVERNGREPVCYNVW